MAPGANSYGTAQEVAALTPRYTSAGYFTTLTYPTLAQVEHWIDACSATLNVMLAKAGFQVPITQSDAKAACAQIVVECVSDLVHAANSAGRFFTERAIERGTPPMKVLRQDMAAWVEDQAAGLAALGAAMISPSASQVAYRETDESGNDVSPMFQREGFGNSFKDWDA